MPSGLEDLIESSVPAPPRRAFEDPSLLLNLALTVVLIACAARLWIMPIGSSFWVDEMVTSYVVHHGSADASLAVAPQVRDSAYYVLPKLSEKLFGNTTLVPWEVAYRLPSLLAMALALFLIAQIAARLIHPAAGWFAVFACLLLPGINYQADDARPYAFGTLVASAAVLFLIRWLDRASWVDAALFIAGGALLWRIHLIFWPFYLALSLYALVRLLRHETSVSALQMAAVFATLALTLIPVAVNAVALFRDAGSHVIVPPPEFRDFKRSLQLALVLTCFGGSWLLAILLRWPKRLRTGSVAALTLLFAWYLSQPVLLFALSWLSLNSMFVARYLYLSLPGAALVATAAAGWFIPAHRWKPLALILGVITLAYMGQWRTAVPVHQKSGWREAAQAINRLNLPEDTPIIYPSPFVEAKPPAWTPDYQLPGFLYAHIGVYPVPGKPFLLPFQPSPEAAEYAATLSSSTLPAAHRFVIFGGDRNVLTWRNFFAHRPRLLGWRNRRLGPFGDVDAVVFEEDEPGSDAISSAGAR